MPPAPCPGPGRFEAPVLVARPTPACGAVTTGGGGIIGLTGGATTGVAWLRVFCGEAACFGAGLRAWRCSGGLGRWVGWGCGGRTFREISGTDWRITC